MIPHKFNKTLFILAILGIFMYFLSNILISAISGNAMEEDMSQPAVSKQAATDEAVRFAVEQLGMTPAETSAIYQNAKYASGYVTKEKLQEPYKSQMEQAAPLNYWVVIINGTESGKKAQIRVSMEQPARITGWDTLVELDKKHNEKGLPAALKALKDGGFSPSVAGW